MYMYYYSSGIGFAFRLLDSNKLTSLLGHYFPIIGVQNSRFHDLPTNSKPPTTNGWKVHGEDMNGGLE